MIRTGRVIVENEDEEVKSSESDEAVSTSESENEINPNSDSDAENDHENNPNADSEAENADENKGWADCIAKILVANKPKRKRTVVLSRAKKLSDLRADKPKEAGFEVLTKDGEVKKELIAPEKRKEPPKKKSKKDAPCLRVKPNILERNHEKLLTKIATKGVVQLFNAVKQQQKSIDSRLKEAGPLERKKEKVLKSIDKRAFLDVLMGDKSQTKSTVLQKNRNKEEQTGWNVLRDDFMMGGKLKDWDKELEMEEENEVEAEMEDSS